MLFNVILGGIGGDREVQPGDEIVLLCCSLHRLKYRQLLHQFHSNSNSLVNMENTLPTSEINSNDINVNGETHVDYNNDDWNNSHTNNRNLILNMGYHQTSTATTSQTPPVSATVTHTEFLQLLEWASVAMVGVEGSPYNFAVSLIFFFFFFNYIFI